MLAKKFQRHIEDFVCENCHYQVIGNGYTNHCPKCLWSKHVDINPGDRQESCQGLMKPIDLEQKAGEQVIIHHCLKCGFERKNRVVPVDDVDEIIKLSTTKL
jgi:rubrerythrin